MSAVRYQLVDDINRRFPASLLLPLQNGWEMVVILWSFMTKAGGPHSAYAGEGLRVGYLPSPFAHSSPSAPN